MVFEFFANMHHKKYKQYAVTVSHKFLLIIIIIYQCWIFAFLLIGTGTNACYIEKLENVGLWDGDYNEPKQVLQNSIMLYRKLLWFTSKLLLNIVNDMVIYMSEFPPWNLLTNFDLWFIVDMKIAQIADLLLSFIL